MRWWDERPLTCASSVHAVGLKYSGINECHCTPSRGFRYSHRVDRQCAICLASGPEWGKCNHKSEKISRPSGAVHVTKIVRTSSDRTNTHQLGEALIEYGVRLAKEQLGDVELRAELGLSPNFMPMDRQRPATGFEVYTFPENHKQVLNSRVASKNTAGRIKLPSDHHCALVSRALPA